MSQNKPIFFYSNYCIYSKELINELQKMNIIDTFILINVSNSKYKIPSFIQSVPSLYFENRVIKDDELDNFIKRKIDTVDKNIDPFFPSEMNSGIGYSYSYIQENNDDNDTNIKNSLMYINDMNIGKIATPDENDFANSSKTNFEKFQADREQDLKKILDSNGQSQERTFSR